MVLYGNWKYDILFPNLMDFPLKGARAKIVQQGGKQLRVVEFDEELIETDWCRLGHASYILEGEIEIDYEGEVVVYSPGHGFIIPVDKKHMASVPKGVCRLILIKDI